MKKLKIKNRKDQQIVVLVEESKKSKGLVFVVHGLGGFKEEEHIKVITDVFKKKEFTTIRFDTTNTFGESDGDYENATVTNYYEDLEDVIKWSQSQQWYKEPFYLAGHSLGSLAIVLYAEKYPKQVKGLAPLSIVVSGKLSLDTYSRAYLKAWEKTGWIEELSASKQGLVKRLKWSHMIDRQKYDVLYDVAKLIMPVILIVGEKDTLTPPKHQKILFENLQFEKEIHIIKNAHHTFREQSHLSKIKKILLEWVGKVERN